MDKVEDYVSSRAEVDGTMKSFQEMISYALFNSVTGKMLIDFRNLANTSSWKPTHKGERLDWMRKYQTYKRHWIQYGF